MDDYIDNVQVHKEADAPKPKPSFTKQFDIFLQKYKAYLERKKREESEDVPKIHVDEIASKIARFYERTRNIIDYREEHLLHKHFIERTLRRRLIIANVANGNNNIAEGFVREVIRAGHLPNDAVPETRIQDIQNVVNAYTAITQCITTSNYPKQKELSQWILKITVSEIEEILFPYDREETFRNFMFNAMREHMAVTPSELDGEGEAMQLFIAIERAFLHSDNDQIRHRLFRFIYPAWNEEHKDAAQICADLPSIYETIEHHLFHPLGQHFLSLARRYDTVFHVVTDIFITGESYEEIERIVNDPSELELAIGEAYKNRFGKEKRRLRRLATLSVISFLLSKIAVAIGIEYPIDTYLGEFSMVSTLINVFVPPFLMLLGVLSIRMPGPENAELVLAESMKIIYPGGTPEYGILIPKKNNAFEGMVYVAYGITFLISFTILYRLLTLVEFSMANFIVFGFFTSLVAATSVRVHNRAKSLSLEKPKRTFLSFLRDLFVMPFVIVGKWSLKGLSKFNFLVFMADLIVEAPFQVFVEFIESFSFFLRSKKEEIH